MRNKLMAALMVTAMLFTGLVGGGSGTITEPTAAEAATANAGVYVIAPKWAGWCPNIRGIKNRVIGMDVTNFTTGHNSNDLGDDIAWSRVRTRVRNRVQVNVGCSLGHGSAGTIVNFTPSRNGQSVFVWPTGGTWVR